MRSYQRMMGLLSLTLVLGCGAEANDETASDTASVSVPIQSFAMKGAYQAFNGFGACSLPKTIAGYEPTKAGRYPVFIYLTGTLMPYLGLEAQRITQEMARRGFVAATVQYDNEYYPPHCSNLEAKANCLFNPQLATSAITKICSHPKAACDARGIVVSGFSQGANLASVSKDYDRRVRAAYLLGHGYRAIVIDLRQCLQDSATVLAPSEIRAVDGEHDQFFGQILPGVRDQLQVTVGRSCPSSRECLQADGSGWYIVLDQDVADRFADHCYYYNFASPTCQTHLGLDPTFETGSAPWSLQPNLNWLASRAR